MWGGAARERCEGRWRSFEHKNTFDAMKAS
jgi:hypothetical protein